MSRMIRTNPHVPHPERSAPQEKRSPGRPSKVEEVACRLGRVIDDVLAKPAERISQAEILRRARVPKSTLDELKNDERIRPLKDLMRGLALARESVDMTVESGVQHARQATAADTRGARPDDLPADVLDTVRIAGVYGEKMRTAVGAMGRFIGRQRQLRHVSALPVSVRELELAVRQLQGVLLALKPLNDQWLDGPGKNPQVAQDERGALELDLRMHDEA